MNITLNPLTLWQKHKSQQQIIRKQCKQLSLNMQFIAELFAEIAEKDERITRLEERLNKKGISRPQIYFYNPKRKIPSNNSQ